MKNALFLKLFFFIYGKHPENNILTWNWLFTRKNHRWVKQNRALFKDKTVADYGCGSCPYFKYLSKDIKKYIALDLVRNDDIPNNPQLFFAQLDSNGALPDAHEKSDIVVSSQVLMEVPDIDFYFSEMAKMLETSGLVFMTISWGMPALGHNDRMRISPFYVVQMLKKYGFNVIKYNTSGYFFSTMFLSLNLLLVSKNKYDISISDISMSKFKWLVFTPMVLLNNVLAVILDCLIPLRRSPSNYLIIAEKQSA